MLKNVQFFVRILCLRKTFRALRVHWDIFVRRLNSLYVKFYAIDVQRRCVASTCVRCVFALYNVACVTASCVVRRLESGNRPLAGNSLIHFISLLDLHSYVGHTLFVCL